MLQEEFQTLKMESQGEGVTYVTLSRPDKLNAVNGVMHRELAEVFFLLAHDRETRMVVLTGDGRAFCAGGDYDWTEIQNSKGFFYTATEAIQIVQGILDCPKPIIARVNGPAVGLGATIALHCDIIVASSDAVFSDPHVSNMGVVAGDGGAIIWPLVLGPARAKEFLFTGQRLTAEKAQEWGLVNSVVPPDQLDPTIEKWLRELKQLPPLAVSYTKQMVNQWTRLAVTKILWPSIAYEGLTMMSKDHGEAIQAFLEKRKPHYTGE